MKKKIIVRGPALSRSGYGEQCRFALRSLRAYEELFDIRIVLTGWGKTSWMIEDDEERRWIDEVAKQTIVEQQQEGFTGYDMSLQVTIPNEWERIAPVNVGYTAGIEASKVAPVWLEKSRMMDRIVVVSNFAKQVFETTTYDATNTKTGEVIKDFKCVTPIAAVNYPVKYFDAANVDLKFDHDFNFLVVAQWGVRKNVTNTIRWFAEKFKDENVGLVLKLNMINNSFMDRFHTKSKIESVLADMKDRKCKVHLIHGNMTDEEMTALYQHPQIKCMISMAHGEGFGLPLFEAAYNAMPIIAPAGRGYCDFLYAPVEHKKTGKVRNKALFARVDYNLAPIQQEAVWKGVLEPGVQWCYPEKSSYQSRLVEVYKDFKRFKSQAEKLQQYVEERFTAERQYKAFAEAVWGTNVEKAAAMQEEKVIVL